MKTRISARSLTLSDTQRDRIERRIYFTLGRFAPRIDSVEMMLEDENGPRGGFDKICRVIVRLRGVKDVVVEGRGQDTLSVVDRTADRAGRAVSRALNMLRSRTSQRANKMVTRRRA